MNDSSEIAFTELTEDSINPLIILLAVFLLILMVITCTGNVLVCVAIYTRPRLQSLPYYCIFSLALADLLVGSVAVPSYLIKKFITRGLLGEIVCDVFRFSYFLTGYASISSLSIISIERAITVTHPLVFSTIVTPARITGALVAIWVDSIAISVLPFIPWQDVTDRECAYHPTRWWSILVINSNVFFPFLIIVMCYSCIYRIARVQTKSIRRENTTGLGGKKQREKSESKANRTIMIIIGFFIICWFPSCLYYFLQMVCEQCFPPSFSRYRVAINALVKLMTFTNSALNPVIYAWRSKEFRSAYFRILLRRNLVRRRANSDETFHRNPVSYHAQIPLRKQNGNCIEEYL